MVGQRIKAYLEENGIKQSFLSEKTGIPSPVLSLMLSGQRKITVSEYYEICQALKIDMNYFMGETA